MELEVSCECRASSIGMLSTKQSCDCLPVGEYHPSEHENHGTWNHGGRGDECHLGLRLSCSAADLLCFVDQIDRVAGTHWVAPVYRVRDFTGLPRNCEPAKHEGPAWYPLDALPARLTTPTRVAVAALRRRAEGGLSA